MRFGVEGSLVRECCISTLPRAFVAQGVPHEEDCGRDEAQVGQDVGNDHRGGRLAPSPHLNVILPQDTFVLTYLT